MDIEVISEKDNALYDRKEVVAKLGQFTVTPSRKEVIEELAKKFGHKESIVIDRITHRFGRKQVEVLAKVYKDVAKVKEIEPSFRMARTEGKKDGGKEGKKA